MNPGLFRAVVSAVLVLSSSILHAQESAAGLTARLPPAYQADEAAYHDPLHMDVIPRRA